MRIIAKKNLFAFTKKHPESKTSIEAWHNEVKNATWKTPQEVINQYPKASTVPGNRIVFRKGNDFRIIAKINYDIGIVFICFIGTHKEYNKVDAETVWLF